MVVRQWIIWNNFKKNITSLIKMVKIIVLIFMIIKLIIIIMTGARELAQSVTRRFACRNKDCSVKSNQRDWLKLALCVNMSLLCFIVAGYVKVGKISVHRIWRKMEGPCADEWPPMQVKKKQLLICKIREKISCAWTRWLFNDIRNIINATWTIINVCYCSFYFICNGIAWSAFSEVYVCFVKKNDIISKN